MTTWLIISSTQNFEITAQQGWSIQGFKRRHRKKVVEMMPGDEMFYYIMGEQKLAARVRITSGIEEAADFIWVNLGKDPTENYPWRVGIAPVKILSSAQWPPIEPIIPSLRYFRKWPEKHWRLGLQGQLHRLFDEDGEVLKSALSKF